MEIAEVSRDDSAHSWLRSALVVHKHHRFKLYGLGRTPVDLPETGLQMTYALRDRASSHLTSTSVSASACARLISTVEVH